MNRLIRGLVACCLSLVLASPAAAAILTPTIAGVPAALKAAQAGDQVQLPSGRMTLVVSKRVNTGAPIIIEPAPGATPIITGSLISASEGFTVRGLAVRSAATGYGLQIANSKRIRVEGSTFDALPADREAGRGLQVKNSQDVEVVGNNFRSLRYGLMGDGLSGFLAEGNDFRDIHGDAIRGWVNSDHLVFRGNTITDVFEPVATRTHVDGIQFWTVGATRPTTDVLIEGNVITRGAGDALQGIFVGNETLVPYERFTIRGNVVAGANWNGIWLVAGKAVVIEDNLVLPMDWDPARHPDLVKENVRSRVTTKLIDGGSIARNVARVTIDKANPNTNVAVNDNVEPAQAALGDMSLVTAWLKRNDPPADPKAAEIATLRAQLADKAAEVSALEARAASAEKGLTSTSADLAAARTSLAALEADLAAATARLSRVAQALKD